MKTKIIPFLLAGLAMTACDDDLKLYDTNQTDSVFFNYVNLENEADSAITYNFGFESTRQHQVDIPVTLMGMPKNSARNIEIRVVTDSTTMTEGVNYTILRHELAANAVEDTVKIMLNRDGDPDILTQTKRLRIEIVENGDLRPTGQKTFDITYSDIRPTDRPSWWSKWAQMPDYSFENAQLFFEYFYRLAPLASKSVFDEMIARYGDYFTKATDSQGPLAMYDSFLYKYVLIPMYKDTKETISWSAGEPKVNY